MSPFLQSIHSIPKQILTKNGQKSTSYNNSWFTHHSTNSLPIILCPWVQIYLINNLYRKRLNYTPSSDWHRCKHPLLKHTVAFHEDAKCWGVVSCCLNRWKPRLLRSLKLKPVTVHFHKQHVGKYLTQHTELSNQDSYCSPAGTLSLSRQEWLDHSSSQVVLNCHKAIRAAMIMALFPAFSNSLLMLQIPAAFLPFDLVTASSTFAREDVV